jgi:plasmid maintenance system antidote protein VapI
MPRLPISADTAVKLAAYMKVPVEHLMHMPHHVMLQKLAEMAKTGGAKADAKPEGGGGESAAKEAGPDSKPE